MFKKFICKSLSHKRNHPCVVVVAHKKNALISHQSNAFDCKKKKIESIYVITIIFTKEAKLMTCLAIYFKKKLFP